MNIFISPLGGMAGLASAFDSLADSAPDRIAAAQARRLAHQAHYATKTAQASTTPDAPSTPKGEEL